MRTSEVTHQDALLAQPRDHDCGGAISGPADAGAKSQYASSTATTPPPPPSISSRSSGGVQRPVGELGLTTIRNGASGRKPIAPLRLKSSLSGTGATTTPNCCASTAKSE